MVDEDIAAARLAAADGYLADVRRFRDEAGRERFLSDRGEQYEVEFPLQQVIDPEQVWNIVNNNLVWSRWPR